MTEIVLPRLAGTRDALRQLLHDQRVGDDLGGRPAVVFCRDLVSGSPSFADELVREVLEVRGARELVLVGAPDLFWDRVAQAATRRGRAGAVRRMSAAEVVV
ncbi:hypothetical protein [Quadrisphaera sp. DSM 44207]|uniref:hypothetical protein n=1 Tax=Quadrisphaera sp. DSM 44207 TaxID=1881057 RepID=UPI00088AB369|nr:hypothetical protein [Quadrisphaera sp. DSM 44207]SDQ10237.1 hypothetical protein SAMN05428996_0535 [Quadrisphaera sp. DSM 44207]